MFVGARMAHPHPSTETPRAAEPGSADGIAMDTLFGALGNSWRRRTIRHLADEPDVEDVEAFVSDLISEHAAGTTDVSSVRIEFYHVHFPKLADVGVVEYDADRGRVTPGRHFEEAAACLFAVREERAYLREN